MPLRDNLFYEQMEFFYTLGHDRSRFSDSVAQSLQRDSFPLRSREEGKRNLNRYKASRLSAATEVTSGWNSLFLQFAHTRGIQFRCVTRGTFTWPALRHRNDNAAVIPTFTPVQRGCATAEADWPMHPRCTYRDPGMRPGKIACDNARATVFAIE